MTVEKSAYGYCPKCGARCIERERRPNGNDICANGHVYPSVEAAKTRRAMMTTTTNKAVIARVERDGEHWKVSIFIEIDHERTTLARVEQCDTQAEALKFVSGFYGGYEAR